ncbi:Trk system potassium transporter TrkA [Aerococcus suis]
MEVIVIGGGKLGQKIIEDLNDEGHQITLIDKNPDVLNRLIDEIDIKGVTGIGTDINVLKDAGVTQAKVVISATPSDEVNVISAMLAKNLGAEYTIIRARNREFTDNESFIKQKFDIDLIINQDREAANDILHVIDFPSASNVEPFYHNRIQLVKVRILADSFLDGMAVSDIRQKLPDLVMVVIERGDETIIPSGDTTLQAKDQVDLFAPKKVLNQFCELAGHKAHQRYRTALIIGGSRVNHYLVPALHARGIRTRIIERDEDRAKVIASRFPMAEVIVGDGTDQIFLREQRIYNFELSLSLTNSDEENIMVSLFAHREGVTKTITKVNRVGLTDLLDASQLDAILSPRISISDAVIRGIRSLRKERGGYLENYARLGNEKTEALEFRLAEDSPICGTPIKDLPLKDHIVIGIIIRDGEVILPTGFDELQPDDHVLIINNHKNILEIKDILKRKVK